MSDPHTVTLALLKHTETDSQYRAVMAVATHGSFEAAARSLGVRRQSVQAQVRIVEARARSKQGDAELPPAPPPRVPTVPELIAVVKRTPLTRDSLAARLHVDVHEIDAVLGAASWQSAPITVTDGLVSYVPPGASEDTIHPILPVAESDEVVRVGVISDTHYGSKFCMRHQITDAVSWMHEELGITTILHPGDWTQGIYSRHSVHEVTATSQRDQLLEMAEWLPKHPGLHYHGIAGNHDETWVDRTGLPFATALAGVWSEVGRNDITIHGSMGAFLDVGGVVVHLWHGGSVAYAASYHLQGKAESYSGIKPSILLAGHVHRYCHVEQRGIECVLCPCFQGGAGPFGKKMKGSPAIGGLALSWRMTTGASFRDFEVKRRRYYERERIHSAANPVHGEVVDEVEAGLGVRLGEACR